MAFWAGWIDSPQELRTKTGDGRDLVVLTGVAVCHWKGTGGAWIRDELLIPVGPAWRRLDDVAPSAALAAISNEQTAVNAGWATDNVRWSNWNARVLIHVAVAVSDIDGWLLRVSYNATAVGLL